MDVFGAIPNASTLISQTFELYRRVSAARDFAKTAGSYSAMIAFEYFRFETWIQQSGFLYIDLEGNPAISNNVGPTEPSTQPRRPGIPLDTSPRGSWTLKAISEIHLILEELEKLKIKYGLDQPYKDSIGRSLQPPFYDQTRQLSTTGSVLPPETQQMRSVLNAVSKSKKQRENLSKHVTFFKKLNFSWALTDDTSDKDKIATLITRLQYWNNNLREMLPPTEQSFNDTLVSTRALSLSEEAECLEQISNAAHLIDGTLYGNIWKAANIKSQRVHGKRSDLIGQKFCGMELSKEHFIKIIDEPERGLTSFIPQRNILPAAHLPVITEWVTFNDNLTMDDFDVLKSRIDKLCSFLANRDVPSSMLIPLCIGYIHPDRNRFILAYDLPPFASPRHGPISLSSMLPGKGHSLQKVKIEYFPTLGQRYKLSATLTDGLLTLLNVKWVHKGLNSSNIVMFHEKTSERLDFSRPQMMGFGIARPEDPGEITIDVRSLDSPFALWQHPDLRKGPHRRYERRHDIYSLGMILFEIGMWKSLHSFEEPGDTPDKFHQRIVNACHSRMAHFMGTSYENAVLKCIDRNELWTTAETEGDDPASLLETFSWEVVRDLRRCATD